MSETKPLHGKKILVTRGREQASDFSEKIRKAGGVPIEIPLLSFTYPNRAETELFEEIKKASSFDWLVFTSKNGVDFFFNLFEKLPLQEQKLPRIAVVGSKTAEALATRGYRADIVPNEFVAEGLVDILKSYVQSNSRIMLARGNLSRKLLVHELESIGVEVNDLIVYNTVANENMKEKLVSELPHIDVVTFTSSSTVTYFLKLIGNTADKLEGIDKMVVACIGPIAKQTAIESGLRVQICPSRYTTDNLLEEIIHYYNQPTKREE
ncbi:uroporphyrinogen-III synthase [Cytobacillus suaedae]|nr:uroporphyrinogen-III synthase [Cytobacillus suaedae]